MPATRWTHGPQQHWPPLATIRPGIVPSSSTRPGSTDLVLVMDTTNRDDVAALGGEPGQVRMFRSFDPDGGPAAEVPDPWYGEQQGFDDVLTMVERTNRALVAKLRTRLG